MGKRGKTSDVLCKDDGDVSKKSRTEPLQPCICECCGKSSEDSDGSSERERKGNYEIVPILRRHLAHFFLVVVCLCFPPVCGSSRDECIHDFSIGFCSRVYSHSSFSCNTSEMSLINAHITLCVYRMIYTHDI